MLMLKKRCDTGLLVTFEGIEGVGKSTQTQLLKDALTAQGLPCYLTREPGGTDFGDRLRACLLQEYAHPLDAQTELCLLLAARRHHLQTVIRPKLAQGDIVIVDRFIDASLAYQGYGRGLSVELIERLHRELNLDLTPSITFLLDAPLEVSRERIKNRIFFDRIEREHNPFFINVRNGYLEIANNDPKRVHVLDACIQADLLAHTIFEKVTEIIYAQ
ncbi:dTMP kinase [bacterium]|nr:dTMP kinase [bacterium]NBW56490.1 dTMP kinase [bacterium]NBX71539.1 dTMP kinase [bacterium]